MFNNTTLELRPSIFDTCNQGTKIRELATSAFKFDDSDVTIRITMAGWHWTFAPKSLESYRHFKNVVEIIRTHGNMVKLVAFLPQLAQESEIVSISIANELSLNDIMKDTAPKRRVAEFPSDWGQVTLTNQEASLNPINIEKIREAVNGFTTPDLRKMK